MSSSKIRIESYDPAKKIIRITPTQLFDFNQDSEIFYQTVFNLTKIKEICIVLDMENIIYPTTSFIAFVVEVGSLLKRNGGDLMILNLSETARTNFVTFSPFSFLRVLDNESEIPANVNRDDQKGQSHHKAEDTAEEQKDISEVNTELENEFSIKDILDKEESGIKEKPKDVPEMKNYEISDLVGDDFSEQKRVESERIVIHSREDQLYKLTDFVVLHAEQAGFDKTEISRIKLSVYESAHNIIEHAYEFDPNQFIEMNLKYDNKQFTATLTDKGKSFEYDPNRNYDAIEAAEDKRTGGFGLHIIRRSMDDVKYESNPVWGNRLTLVKNIP